MRPYILVVLIGLLLPGSAGAQYQFGLIGGPLYDHSRVKVNAGLPPGTVLTIPEWNGFGYHAGVWYRSDGYHVVHFRAGLNWCYRAFSSGVSTVTVGEDGRRDVYTGDRQIHLNYLELPVQGQYYFWKGAHVDLGVQFARMMYGQQRDQGRTVVTLPRGNVYEPDPIDVVSKNVDAFTRFEFAMIGGVGCDFKGGLVLGASYVRAVTPVEYDAGSALRTRFDQVRLSVGYDFLHPKGRRVFR
jgi:Outer membrane protein beta-barrel domain